MNAGGPSAHRQRLFVGLLMLFALALAEVSAHVGLRAIDGGWNGPAGWQRAREAAGTRREEAVPDAPATRAFEQQGRGIVIHPFFGFTRDPAVPNRWWDVTPDGFFTRRPPLTEPTRPERFTVAILGGSVANHFAFGAWDRFARTLAPTLGTSRFAVRFESLAMGGYKQPQQMNILAHRLARGDRFDAVINLDGFNDVVLPLDNLRAGTAPLYPVNWPDRVAGLPDVDRQSLSGEIRFIDRLRASRAGQCPGLLRLSAVCHLTWRLRDASLVRQQNALRVELASQTDARRRDARRFELHGPLSDPATNEDPLPLLVAFWQRSSLQMDAMARLYDLPYFHALQPNQYVPGSKPLSAEERRRFYDPEKSHREIIERAYPMLRAAGRDLAADGVRFIDLTMLFEDVEETLYMDDCCHLNTRGNDRLGEAIGRVVATAIAATRGDP